MPGDPAARIDPRWKCIGLDTCKSVHRLSLDTTTIPFDGWFTLIVKGYLKHDQWWNFQPGLISEFRINVRLNNGGGRAITGNAWVGRNSISARNVGSFPWSYVDPHW